MTGLTHMYRIPYKTHPRTRILLHISVLNLHVPSFIPGRNRSRLDLSSVDPSRTLSRSKDECERHCYETLGVCTTGLSYPMSSSRYRAFYFVFNIFTGHVILLKHCSDVKYQYDRPHGKWRPHLYSLIYCSFFGALF